MTENKEQEKRTGRPPKYTRELADKVCELISEGWSLLRIEREGIVSHTAVNEWVLDDVDGFAARYARARVLWLDRMAEETAEMADDSISYASGEGASAAVQARRLAVDTRKWLLSKLRPGVYGDKVSQEISGPGGGPVSQRVELVFVPPPAAKEGEGE